MDGEQGCAGSEMQRVTMMKSLNLLFAGGVALMVGANSARAGVVWTFFETACTAENAPGCETPPLPFAVGQLILPDINSSGTYLFSEMDNEPPIETGDKNFSFEWGGFFTAPPSHSCVFGTSPSCIWRITFASSQQNTGALSLSARVDHGGGFDDNIDIGASAPFWSGMIGSDDFMQGCGTFRECEVSGIVAVTSFSVPEPASLAVLSSALIGMFLFVRRRKAYPNDGSPGSRKARR